MAVSWEALPEPDEYRGRGLQPTVGLSNGSQMEELEKGLKEVKGFATLSERQYQQPDSPELPGTKPPTKEYTWRDSWLLTFLLAVLSLCAIRLIMLCLYFH